MKRGLSMITLVLMVFFLSAFSDCLSRSNEQELPVAFVDEVCAVRGQIRAKQIKKNKATTLCVSTGCDSTTPVSAAQSCAPIVIVETGSPQTLTEPGTYCLGSDLTHMLSIEGSNITLDMNGHVIFVAGSELAALVVQGLVTNVCVYGGFITGQVPASLVVGIAVLDAFETRIHDITIENCRFGMILVGDNDPDVPYNDQPPVDTRINTVLVRNNIIGIFCVNDIGTVIANTVGVNNEHGLASQPSINLRIESSIAADNAGIGIALDGNNDAVIVNCVANENGSEGFRISNSMNCVVRDCVASGNGFAGFGVSLTGSNINFFDCTALRNSGDGFLLEAESASYFGCSALYNGRNTARDGFRIFPSSTALVRGCIAENNGGYGFNSNNSSHQFYSNIACVNVLSNYQNVDTALISSPANVRGVHNVDCASNTPDQIEAILATLNATVCDVTSISETGSDQVISTPGHYCLTEDLSHQLIIDVSGVELDLNGHMISVPAGQIGVNISPGFSNISVYNGFINGGTIGNYGLNVSSGAVNIRIEDVVCEACVVTGIQINDGAQRVIVSGVLSNNHGTNGIFCGDCLDVVIADTRCIENGFAGMQCINSHNLAVQRCSFSANDNSGIYLDTVVRAEIVDSLFDDNALFGLQCLNTTQDILVRGCIASSNTDGFAAMGSSNQIVWLSSVAFGNSNAGFSATDSSSVLMRECTANNNDIGFSNGSSGSVLLYSTSACFNTTNYGGTIVALVVGAGTALYWQNVDCTL